MDDVNEPVIAADDELQGAVEGEAMDASAAETSGVSEAEYEQVKRERDQLMDRIARLQAEFENARRREAKERMEFRDYALGQAAEGLLPALDNFDLALKSNGTPEQFRAGVDLIAKQLDEAVRGLGLTHVETVGAQFDPHVHEALGQVETAEFPDGAVVQEIRRGYKVKDRLLRPALVQIARNPQQREA
ncbi:nucleotide exchange factor GrpE [Terriglobus sp.]|uniref:nucleotide exchange factor GrpE n=1 Tax=Terriglobus sp. TaxID=1889013 RepID=UPI003B005F98